MPAARPIRRVLVANRGEIAVRVINTCRKLGISTVAVFSDADRDSLYVTAADQAVHIGGSQPSESYLAVDKIIDAARRTNADAIHPGYGFLSENAEFATRCADAGITFIGPPASAINHMGDKANAKALLTEKSKSVPLIPGYGGGDQSVARLLSEGGKIGFPVLVKAAAGGGGRGMRVVNRMEDLEEAIVGAQREAQSAFGSPVLLMEKYFSSSKHVEIQIFGDTHGNVSHVLERECSVQRRHQKVIEETPCPLMTPDLRKKMTTAAEEIGRIIGYVGAGTVEFLVDCSGQGMPDSFYFLEVNTRLQVEHPITEEVTGLDLVECMLHVAQGGTLLECGITHAAERGHQGHAIECRVCAEDPSADFAPACGTILRWKPSDIPGLRYDSGVHSGATISVFYDSMIAKVITHADTREAAIQLMNAALQSTQILGIRSNQRFLQQVLDHEAYLDGSITTQFIGNNAKFFQDLNAVVDARSRDEALDVALAWDWAKTQAGRTLLKHAPSAFRSGPRYRKPHRIFRLDGTDNPVTVEYMAQQSAPNAVTGVMQAWTDGAEAHSVEVLGFHPEEASAGSGEIEVTINGVRQRYGVAEVSGPGAGALWVHLRSAGSGFLVHRVPKLGTGADAADAASDYSAPMPARVLRVLVASGDSVTEGQPLLSIESMKMESVIKARAAGTVKVLVKEGQLVEAAAPLVVIE
ncbi:hypothetical protein CYMTET_23717 [Cymbomonas tetramitiformis]|uniref:Uncharacterized protein n=1 Tax=Cymbomonas tetramitiformis TaxID=36881 RepID=A0AAE0FX83_9CHLO|nr:hypothetical protein CYMTET_23717 [Cymbomonas tetramitiformis]